MNINSTYSAQTAEKKLAIETPQNTKWQTAACLLAGTVAVVGLGCLIAATSEGDTITLPLIPLRDLPRVSGLCPVADPYHQFNIANYLSGHLTQHIEHLAEQARQSSYDTFNKPDGNSFIYGISSGEECLRIDKSQFDSLNPIEGTSGFEFKRSNDGRIDLVLQCKKQISDLKCESVYIPGRISYEALEDRNKIVEKLCIDKICEIVTSPKNQPTPYLLNKLLHITNKA